MSALGLTATVIATQLHVAIMEDLKNGWRPTSERYGAAVSKAIREIAAELVPMEVVTFDDAITRLSEAGITPGETDYNKSFLVTPHACPNCKYVIQVGHEACRRRG